MSDIRRVGRCKTDAEAAALLSMNVLEFLRSTDAGGCVRSLTPLVLHPDDTFGTAIELMAASRAHRVYVVHGRKPAGVLSATTVLAMLVSTIAATNSAKETHAVK